MSFSPTLSYLLGQFSNNQLVCLPLVGIFKLIVFIWNICSFQFK